MSSDTGITKNLLICFSNDVTLLQHIVDRIIVKILDM